MFFIFDFVLECFDLFKDPEVDSLFGLVKEWSGFLLQVFYIILLKLLDVKFLKFFVEDAEHLKSFVVKSYKHFKNI